jgi:bifunctional ADP-heptose synthase (sugar kinase/adenylyltransferase)
VTKTVKTVKTAADVNILVVGDVVYDSSIYVTSTSRPAPEDPEVLIRTMRNREVDVRLGGAGNAAACAEALGARVEIWGTHESQRCVKFRAYDPITKRLQFRADHDIRVTTTPLMDKRMDISRLAKCLENADAVIISDYGKGFCTPDLCQYVIKHAKGPVLVDPHGPDWSKYRGVYAVFPNQKEYDEWDKTEIDWPTRIVRKMGPLGARVIDRTTIHSVKSYPAMNHNPVDVTGAGDAVIAACAVRLAQDYTVEESVKSAMIVAGVVCGKQGTQVCTEGELFHAATFGF